MVCPVYQRPASLGRQPRGVHQASRGGLAGGAHFALIVFRKSKKSTLEFGGGTGLVDTQQG